VRRPTPWIALLAVVTLAAVLRSTRLFWGLSQGTWFFDEVAIWQARIGPFARLGWRSFDQKNLGYPTLYGYLAGLTAWGVSQFDVSIFSRPTTLIACERAVSALAGVLAVLVVGRTASAMYGPWVGVAAAAFLATAPLDVMQTHYASVETLLVLATALVIGASWRLVERRTAGWAILGGAAVGIATASKYPGVVLGTAVAWAIVESAWAERSLTRAIVLAIAAAVGFVAAFAITCPPCVLRPDALAKSLRLTGVLVELNVADNNALSPYIGWWGRRWLHQLVAVMPYGLGLPVALLAYAGVAVAAARRIAPDRLLLAALLPFYVFIGSYVAVYPRYVLPLFPGLAILAAAALPALLRPRAAVAVAVLVVAYGIALSESQLSRFSWDQQAAVAQWLGARVARLPESDRRVGITGNLDADPFFRLKRPITAQGYSVVVQRRFRWLEGRPAYFVVPEWHAIAIRRDRRSERLVGTLDALDAGKLGYHRVLRIPIPPYLQRPLDECLDPAFAVDLWQGAIGFTVYARDDLPPDPEDTAANEGPQPQGRTSALHGDREPQ
jgi:hypothetical protein